MQRECNNYIKFWRVTCRHSYPNITLDTKQFLMRLMKAVNSIECSMILKVTLMTHQTMNDFTLLSATCLLLKACVVRVDCHEFLFHLLTFFFSCKHHRRNKMFFFIGRNILFPIISLIIEKLLTLPRHFLATDLWWICQIPQNFRDYSKIEYFPVIRRDTATS